MEYSLTLMHTTRLAEGRNRYEYLAKSSSGMFSLMVECESDYIARKVAYLYIKKWGFEVIHEASDAFFKSQKKRRVFNAYSNYPPKRKESTYVTSPTP